MIYHLARRRTFFFPVGLVVMLVLAKPTWPTYLAGLLLVILGEIVRFWAAGHIRKSISLTSSGPFGCVRNPLYAGSFVMTVGYGVISNSLAAAVFAIVLFGMLHTAAILYEERQLSKLFGQEFTEYCKSVPRLFPKWPRGEPRQYSWRQAIENSEHKSALFAAAAALAFAARALVR
ncbi:MAG: isoprenylcysteine carboxylmethyltransferase family protein [Armatimonadota bacterium]|nr:isoprenylcysteine carboxylmethyltransferase family protein [Armatimonadota bacterium]